MHVRLSDKHTEDARQADRGLERYTYAARQLARWQVADGRAMHLVSSEDPRVPALLERQLGFVRAVSPRWFAMDMRGDNVFRNIRQSNRRLAHLYATNATTRDEGAALVVLIRLMASAQRCIASFSSNVAIVVSDLRSAAAAAPVDDVLGRPYCGCGASFCMGDEQGGLRAHHQRRYRPATKTRASLSAGDAPPSIRISRHAASSETRPKGMFGRRERSSSGARAPTMAGAASPPTTISTPRSAHASMPSGNAAPRVTP